MLKCHQYYGKDGVWAVVGGEYSSDNILVEFQIEYQVDLLCDPGTSETGITPLHLDDSINDFL